MRVATTLAASAALLAAPAVAQQVNTTYLNGLITALKGAGFTQLAAAAMNISNTTSGMTLYSALSSNASYTIFAPNDHAFVGVPANVSSNVNTLAATLAYHVVPGMIPNNTFATSPNHTVLRTVLNDTSYVNLGQNVSQVLALTKDNSTGKVLVWNQNTNVSVLNTTMYQNLVIHTIDAVIDLPHTMTTELSSNFSTLTTVLQTANLLSTVENAQGITLFAPSNAALQAAASMISQVNNATLVQTVLANHVINGTAVYSPQLGSSSFTSGAGQPFSFASNGTGTYVTSGNSTARIIRSDVIVNNGVIHEIDNVLFNTQSNTGAASSAYQSATSAVASAAATQSGPIGSSISSPSATSGSGGNGGSGNAGFALKDVRAYSLGATVAALGGLLGVAVLL